MRPGVCRLRLLKVGESSSQRFNHRGDRGTQGKSLLGRFRQRAVVARADDALTFFDWDGLPRVIAFKFIDLAAGPANFNAIGFGLRAYAKGENQFALRKIARAGAKHFLLLVAS